MGAGTRDEPLRTSALEAKGRRAGTAALIKLSEHALRDEVVGAVDKDKGLLSVQSALFFIFYFC